jgi:mRNA interferase MazF
MNIASWFGYWTEIKIKIHLQDRVLYFKEREIWWVNIGANIGFEENGKNDNYERPIIIYKRFNQDMIWAIPLTRSYKEGRYYYRLDGLKSTALLSQLRMMSTKRLIRRMAIVDVDSFEKLNRKMKAI